MLKFRSSRRFWYYPLLVLLMFTSLAGLITLTGAAARPESSHASRAENSAAENSAVQPSAHALISSELMNPGFEENKNSNVLCDVYDANDNFSHQQGFGNIVVPDGWTLFFKNGLPSGGIPWDPDNSEGWGQPEAEVIPNTHPYDNPPRVHSGQAAFKLFTFSRIHDAGLYQQVQVAPGSWWRLSAWVHAWSSCEDDATISECPGQTWDPEQISQLVGLDPTGGTNPYAPSVVWSDAVHVYDAYSQTQTNPKEVIAEGNTLTVFLRSNVKWRFKHNDLYWDTVVLERIGLDNLAYMPEIFKPKPPPPPPPPPPSASSAEFGMVFVNPAEPGMPTDEGRYQKAADLGIGWDRWPLYWYHVESSAGQYNWSAYDPVVEADLNHGLQINAIFMGTPGFYSTQGVTAPAPPLGYKGQFGNTILSSASPPSGLYEPVFSDGSDAPAPSKTINPNNPWANLVYQAVERYRPGGVLAGQKGWPADRGIRTWEIWNEPDLPYFWNGSVADYARLLKVAALAARQADPYAVIMTAGLANQPAPGYLAGLLATLAQDPNPALRDSQGWYFNAVALHNYAWSWDTGQRIRQARQELSKYNAVKDRPIWINESGVAVYDDYPGPTWQQNGEANYMATMVEQSAYTIQNAAFGLYYGASVIFHFQLYDGCGNDPPNTDFPPDARYLCDQGQICASASAFGLWRNKTSDSCYKQHPNPDTGRPAFSGFRTAVQTLTGAQPLWHEQPDGDQEWFAFYRPDTKQRVIALWARNFHDVTAHVPAVASQARLLDQDGSSTTIYPSNGSYSVSLPAATNRNLPLPPDGSSSIGGRTYFLIENWNRSTD